MVLIWISGSRRLSGSGLHLAFIQSGDQYLAVLFCFPQVKIKMKRMWWSPDLKTRASAHSYPITADCMEIVFRLVTIEAHHLMCRCVWNLKFVVEKKTNSIHSHIKCQLAFHDVYRYLFCFPKCLNQNHCQSTALMREVQRLLFIISWNLIEL